MVSESAPVCPRCGQIDKVTKVLAIVSESISVGQYESVVPLQVQGKTIYLPSQRAIVSSNLLAQRLMWPQQPKKPERSHVRLKPTKIPREHQTHSFLWNWVIGIPAFVLSIPVAALLGLQDIVSWLVVFGVLLLLTFYPTLLAFRYFFPSYKAYARWRKEDEALAKREIDLNYQEDVAIYNKWPAAVEKWQRLYYCARDDGVFVPNQSRFVPVEQMQSFLYE